MPQKSVLGAREDTALNGIVPVLACHVASCGEATSVGRCGLLVTTAADEAVLATELAVHGVGSRGGWMGTVSDAARAPGLRSCRKGVHGPEPAVLASSETATTSGLLLRRVQ